MKAQVDAIIITDQPPFVNDGVGDYSHNLMNCLNSENLLVETFCGNDKYAPHNLYHPFFRPWGIKSLIILYNVIRSKRPRWILFQYVPYAYSKTGIPILIPFFLLIVRFSGIKIHTNFHEISIRLWSGTVSGFFRAIGQRLTAYLICLFANSIQTSNKYYASLIYPFKTTILPIPSNFELIYNTLQFDELSSLEKNDHHILSSANRCNNYFFEVISLLFELNPSFKLIIMGRATPSDLLFVESKLAAYKLLHRVEILVNLPPEEYIKLFFQSTIYFQFESVNRNGEGGVSSKSGLMATALMVGTPIITTKGDLTDTNLFVDQLNVLFIPTTNSKLAIDAVNLLISNDKYRSRIKQNGKEMYYKKFSWVNTIKHIKSVLAA